MKSFRVITHLLLLVLSSGCATATSTNLLPGLTCYDTSEKLSGKLVFLLRRDYTQELNSETAASVYEFDLAQRKLRKVCDSPWGRFHTSDQGDVFCVVYWPGTYSEGAETNAFVYSDALHLSRVVTFEHPPKRTAILSGHVFFETEVWDYRHNTAVTRLCDYSIIRDEKRFVRFPDSSKWQHEKYSGVLQQRNSTNVVHFHYMSSGNRLGDGKDYPEGYYGFDIENGRILGPAKLADDEYDKGHVYKSFDGRYIFFEGSGAPAQGFKLVSSPLDHVETEVKDPKGKKVKVLQRFSVLPAIGGGIYLLSQMSPDGRYALVRLQEPTSRKSGMLPGHVNRYYLVDASNGKTQVLLQDGVERTTVSSIFVVRWVGSAHSVE